MWKFGDVPGYGRDLVPRVDGLLEHEPANSSRGPDDGDFNAVTFLNASTFAATQLANVLAGWPRIVLTSSVSGAELSMLAARRARFASANSDGNPRSVKAARAALGGTSWKRSVLPNTLPITATIACWVSECSPVRSTHRPSRSSWRNAWAMTAATSLGR